MATHFDSIGSVQISDVLSCIICKKENNTSPLVQLSCFHVCHKSCLKKSLISAEPGSRFNCNECKYLNLLPANGIDGLQEEILQFKMKEIATVFSNTPAMCNVCEAIQDEAVSTHFCNTCKVYLCATDSKRHALLPDHKIITIEDIQTEKYLPQVLSSKSALCPSHSTKILEFYCQDCQVPLCQVCNGADHKSHKSITMQEATKKFKEDLKNGAENILPKKRDCELVINKLEILLTDIEQNSKQQIEEYKKWGDTVKQIVDELVETNIQNISVATKAQKDHVQKLLEETNYKNKQFQNTKDYLDVIQRFASESDILPRYKSFEASIEKLLQQNTKVHITINMSKKMDTKNVKDIKEYLGETLDVINFDKNYLIPESAQLRGYLLESTWEADCRTIGVSVDGDYLLSLKEKKIEVHGLNGQKERQITCQEIKNAWDIELVNEQIFVSDRKRREIVVIDTMGNVQRKISLPAEEKGKNWELGLAVDHIREDVYVVSRRTKTVYRCQKGQTQAHPFITTGLSNPYYLCVSPTHEVIVSYYSSDTVSKYSSEGTLMWKYKGKGTGKGKLDGPGGICVDPWGHIFVCDYYHHMIHVLSSEGNFLSSINLDGNIKYPWAITFNDNRIIITNYYAPYNTWVIKCLYH